MEKSGLGSPVQVVVLGGSSGSLEVLFKLLPGLKPELAVPIIIVLHRRYSSESSLSELLAFKTNLPLHEVEDKDPILPGHIYLAPANYHLLVEADLSLSLDYSEKVHFSRPSIDVTFETAADVYGSGAAGIILSGANEDGTRGLLAIKNAGGLVIAQNPDTARTALMPQSAINHVAVDHILEIDELTNFINNLPVPASVIPSK